MGAVMRRFLRWYGARLAKPATSVQQSMDAQRVREGKMSREEFFAKWT